MFNERIFNFSAGPSMLPLPVLERAAKEMLNYGGSGMSVMEMSHRSKVYAKIFADTKEKLAQGERIREVDWSKTRAIQTRCNSIYVNLKGRNPYGIVNPEDKYAITASLVLGTFST